MGYLAEAGPTALKVDVGDFVAGFYQTGGAPLEPIQKLMDLMIASYNEAGLHALTPGEAELSLGLAGLQSMAAKARFPLLAANLVKASDGSRPLQGLVVLPIGGHKVGLVGLLGEDLRGVRPQELAAADLLILPPGPVLKASVPLLRQAGADVVVALAHVGDPELDRVLDEAGAGVQVVLQGHPRSGYAAPRQYKDVVVLSAGYRGKEVGRAELRLGSPGAPLRDGDGATSEAKKLRGLEARKLHYEGQVKELSAKQAAGQADPAELRRLEAYRRNLERMAKEAEDLGQRVAALSAAPAAGAGSYRFDRVRMGAEVKDLASVVALLAAHKADEAAPSPAAKAPLSTGTTPLGTKPPPSTGTQTPMTTGTAPAGTATPSPTGTTAPAGTKPPAAPLPIPVPSTTGHKSCGG